MQLLIREAQFSRVLPSTFTHRHDHRNLCDGSSGLERAQLGQLSVFYSAYSNLKQRSLSTSGNYKSDATVTSKQSDFHFFSTFYGLDDIMLELLEQCLLGSWNQSSISCAFSTFY
ncbi:hypothetical protein T12_4928 [Trichinella patagoniensis]|uniref:Uncharacterized protein n=1 Tax=Trichinella patagoniensis TaxID=990121 RepID=A0A0V0Z5M6_9BILA|nr:hypothetical protein T12_4928 [Trichinella patagoniensis]